LLSAFDLDYKCYGFYEKELNTKSNPSRLILDDKMSSSILVKAKNANVWIVQRENAALAPNYYITKDWKTFVQISNVRPEESFNWLTAELINWKRLDGTIGQGILYKPENFDPAKKYPVIFHYYEHKSYLLNYYERPELTCSEINIPWFVSRGYLVCTPDIDYKIGEPGESALNCVESAARFLIQMPWVDAKKMGLQGHSFGGYQTNYIVTHSNLFAAAAEASGTSDFISDYGGLIERSSIGAGISAQGRYENSQSRIGATLWQRPDLYIKNSPIFFVDKVTTPLLMMSNKNDITVAFEQAIELFTALRRLNKRGWLLQYDDSHHALNSKESSLDYTIRLTQFFDHYLKGAPPPKWMTQGIPAKLKGVENGYELDPNGSCGNDCPICKKKRYK
jgi:dipeptidyl aminopeptidase/acylaminoacyl peptidase